MASDTLLVSWHANPAIDDDGLSRDIARIIGREEERDVRHFLGRAGAFQHGILGTFLHFFNGTTSLLMKFRPNDAWSDRVHANVRTKRIRHGPRHGDDTLLGSIV